MEHLDGSDRDDSEEEELLNAYVEERRPIIMGQYESGMDCDS